MKNRITSMQIILFCFLAASSMYSQSLPLDENKIPLPANGQYLVTKIFISPNIYLWEGDSIKSNYHDRSITDLGSYLINKFEIDTLAKLHIEEEKVFITYNSLIINKQFIDFGVGVPMRPVFNPSRIQIGHFTYDIPLVIKGDEQIVRGLFKAPENRFILESSFQGVSNNTLITYHITVEAEMTHRVSREDRKSLIPLAYPHK